MHVTLVAKEEDGCCCCGGGLYIDIHEYTHSDSFVGIKSMIVI